MTTPPIPEHQRSTGARPEGADTDAAAAHNIQQMFSAIAPTYDRANHLLSFGLDRLWWTRAARTLRPILRRPEALILDLCCGTGDMTLALNKHRPRPSTTVPKEIVILSGSEGPASPSPAPAPKEIVILSGSEGPASPSRTPTPNEIVILSGSEGPASPSPTRTPTPTPAPNEIVILSGSEGPASPSPTPTPVPNEIVILSGSEGPASPSPTPAPNEIVILSGSEGPASPSRTRTPTPAPAPILAADFSHPMLARGAQKFIPHNILPIEADALHLPIASNSLDLVTFAFGFRNLADYPAGLAELHRVLRPGGQIAILEANQPSGLIGFLYSLYFHRILPALGGLISRSPGAYAYLPASVARFPRPPRMKQLILEAGFSNPTWTSYTFGAAGLYRATKP